MGEPSPHLQILDLGCGSGLLTRWLTDKGFDAQGVDFSHGLLEIAQKEHPDIFFTESNIISTPYPDGSFDIVVSGLVMHYVQDLTTVFTEVVRILRDGGAFIFTMHHPFDEVMEVTYKDNSYQPTMMPYFHSDRYTWEMLDGMRLTPYHHTFETIAEALFTTGFVIERIVESRPKKDLRDAYPDFFARTNSFPSFCGFRARKV